MADNSNGTETAGDWESVPCLTEVCDVCRRPKALACRIDDGTLWMVCRRHGQPRPLEAILVLLRAQAERERAHPSS